MEIPNYDNIFKDSKSSFRQLYPYLPKDTFRMMISGPSNSGKTCLLLHLINEPLLYFDQIFLFARNLEQQKYKFLRDRMSKISNQLGYPVLICSNDEIIPVEQIQDTHLQRLVIFDDFVTETDKKKREQIISYFIQGRHRNCSVLFLTQTFYGCDRKIRLNCSHFCLYDFPSSRERNLISQELGIDKNKYIACVKQPYSFCYVDKPMKTVKRNFYGNI